MPSAREDAQRTSDIFHFTPTRWKALPRSRRGPIGTRSEQSGQRRLKELEGVREEAIHGERRAEVRRARAAVVEVVGVQVLNAVRVHEGALHLAALPRAIE